MDKNECCKAEVTIVGYLSPLVWFPSIEAIKVHHNNSITTFVIMITNVKFVLHHTVCGVKTIIRVIGIT